MIIELFFMMIFWMKYLSLPWKKTCCSSMMIPCRLGQRIAPVFPAPHDTDGIIAYVWSSNVGKQRGFFWKDMHFFLRLDIPTWLWFWRSGRGHKKSSTRKQHVVGMWHIFGKAHTMSKNRPPKNNKPGQIEMKYAESLMLMMTSL